MRAGEALEAAHVGIRALVHAARAGSPAAGPRRSRRARLGAGREQLHDDGIAVAVGDDTGQSVGLAVDDAARGVPVVEHRRARCRGARDRTREERIVDRRVGLEAPHAGADLRCGDQAARAANAPSASTTSTVSPGAGVAFDRVDRAGKDPRMPQRERLLAPGLEPDDAVRPVTRRSGGAFVRRPDRMPAITRRRRRACGRSRR